MKSQIINGNALHIPLADETVQCAITSPPYFGLRDYDTKDQLGNEETIEKFVHNLVMVMRDVRRVLKPDGVLWLNIGDSYAGNKTGKSIGKTVKSKRNANRWGGGDRAVKGLPAKNLMLIPYHLAIALQADGWWVRQDVIWNKPNPMPESVKDRCTKAHEYIFLLSKSMHYYFNSDAIKEPAVYSSDERKKRVKANHKSTPTKKRKDIRAKVSATSFKRKVKESPPPGQPKQHRQDRDDVEYDEHRNKRSVWTIATAPYKEAHFAAFPPKLVVPMILSGSRADDIVLDPFAGTATVGEACIKHQRKFVGIELNPEYIKLARKRTSEVQIALPL